MPKIMLGHTVPSVHKDAKFDYEVHLLGGERMKFREENINVPCYFEVLREL